MEEEGRKKEELVVVTWNVQRMSLENWWKRKARRVAKFAREQKWDVVLLSEVKASDCGLVWLGQDEELVS